MEKFNNLINEIDSIINDIIDNHPNEISEHHEDKFSKFSEKIKNAIGCNNMTKKIKRSLEEEIKLYPELNDIKCINYEYERADYHVWESRTYVFSDVHIGIIFDGDNEGTGYHNIIISKGNHKAHFEIEDEFVLKYLGEDHKKDIKMMKKILNFKKMNHEKFINIFL
jgi:hypothetical protein